LGRQRQEAGRRHFACTSSESLPADKGKPVERRRRKASRLQSANYTIRTRTTSVGLPKEIPSAARFV